MLLLQFSRSVMCDSDMWPHGLQHVRLPCPSPTPGAYSNSCPLSRWCHPTISSSVVPFSSCLQSFPASGSFPMSQFFVSGVISILICICTIYIIIYLSVYLYLYQTKHESESCSVLSNSAIPWPIQSMEFSSPEYWSG